jgi:hypothetical protein
VTRRKAPTPIPTRCACCKGPLPPQRGTKRRLYCEADVCQKGARNGKPERQLARMGIRLSARGGRVGDDDA